MNKLTIKQKKFADEYIISGNATEAATKAGYSEKTAYSSGQRLLKKVEITEYIRKRQEEERKKYDIRKEDIISEYAAIGFNDVSEFISIKGRRVIIKSTDDLSPQQRRAISSIKKTKFGIEVTFYDKPKALDSLCRILGFNEDKITVQGEINNPLQGLTTEDLKKLIEK